MCTYIIVTTVSKEAIHQVLQLRKLEKKNMDYAYLDPTSQECKGPSDAYVSSDL